MDDAFLVRRLQCLSHLPRNDQGLVQVEAVVHVQAWSGRTRPTYGCEPLGQRFPFDELHCQELDALRLFESVDRGDVRMIERSEQLRFALQAPDAFGIAGQRGGQDFDGDLTLELRVRRAVDLAHSASANGGDHLIRTESGAGSEGQGCVIILATGAVP